jgi:hypothetical protein
MEGFGALLYTSVTTERPSEPADPPARRAGNRINTEAALADWMVSLGLDAVSVHRVVHQVTPAMHGIW